METVKAELRGAQAAPTVAPVAEAPTVDTAGNAPVTTAAAPVAAPPAISSVAVTAVTAAEPVAAPSVTASASGVTDMPSLMLKITSSGLSHEQITAAANSLGLASLPLIGSRPDLIPAMAAKVDELLMGAA